MSFLSGDHFSYQITLNICVQTRKAIVVVTGLAMCCPWLLIDAKQILQQHRVAQLSGKPTETLEDLTLHALGRSGHGARFPAEIYTRGCHWIPRMFA
jgi:hypothetical protein